MIVLVNHHIENWDVFPFPRISSKSINVYRERRRGWYLVSRNLFMNWSMNMSNIENMKSCETVHGHTMTYHLFLPRLDQKATPLFHCLIWVYSMCCSISRSGDFSWRSTTATGFKPGRDCILMAFIAGWGSECSTGKRNRNWFFFTKWSMHDLYRDMLQQTFTHQI